MNIVYQNFLNYSNDNYKRVLTCLDRDEDSKTYGCFDRNYWHYKFTDFNSSTLIHGLYILASLYQKIIPNKYDKTKIKKLIYSSLIFYLKEFYKDKHYNEYYPYEDSYASLAFPANVLSDILNIFRDFKQDLFVKNTYVDLINKLSRLEETGASNQYATGIAALYKSHFFHGISFKTLKIYEHKKKLLLLQNHEGWFNEYDGFDLGYLSVTLDALVDIYNLSRDREIQVSIKKIVNFFFLVIDKNGKFPSTLNSRNTEYVVPYGLVRSAKYLNESNYLVNIIFKDFRRNDHIYNSYDDRYHSHYLFSSLVRSIPFLKNLNNKKFLPNKKKIFFQNAGIIKKYYNKQKKTIYIGIKKGGVLRIHDHKKKKIILQNGFRLKKKGNKIWTTNWQSQDWNFIIKKDEIYIKGYLAPVNLLKSTLMKHFFLRILSFFFRSRLINILKNIIIFRKFDLNKKYTRKINFFSNKIVITDYFENLENFTLFPNFKNNLRYVASADVFSNEDFTENLLNEKKKINKKHFIIKKIIKL